MTHSLIESISALAAADDRIVVLWLYGSQATGTANERSDFNLALAFKEPLPDTTDNYLRPELLAMDWRKTLKLADDKLSVVDINRAPVPLAYNVISLGKVVFCCSDLCLRAEEQRIWSLWEHYKYEHEHNRTAL